MRTRLLLAALLCSTAVLAQPPAAPKAGAHKKAATTTGPDRSRIPPPGTAPKLVLPKPERFTLSSGTPVWVVERHTLPMVAVAVVWPQGAGDEPVERAGVANLTADLLEEGTTRHDAIALAEALQSLGTRLSSGGGWDATVVSMSTLAKHLDESLALLAEVVSQPAIAPRDFERVRAEHLAALLQQRDSASAMAGNSLNRVVYGPEQRYGLPLLGTESVLKSLGRDDVLRWIADRLGPRQATLLVVGDVKPKTLKAQLDHAFAGWTAAAPQPAPPSPMMTPALPGPRRVVIDKPGAPQSELRLGEAGPPRNSPDYFSLLLMNEILGGGEFANRLNLNLREAHAYTYGAWSGFAFRRDGGPFVIGSATKTAVTGPAVGEAFGEFLRIRSAPVKPEELRFAKDSLVRGMARAFETLNDVLGELASEVVYGLPADYLATYAKHVEAVSIADVQRVARAQLDPARLSVVVVGDSQALAPQLHDLPIGRFEVVSYPELKPAPPPTKPEPAQPAPPPTPSAK